MAFASMKLLTVIHTIPCRSRKKKRQYGCVGVLLLPKCSLTVIDDFFNYIKTSNSGTYLNGYMVIDANTKEMSLIEMSYKRFAMLRSERIVA